MSDARQDYSHLPVMPEQVMEFLAPRPGDTAIDGTVGLGGHAAMIGAALGAGGRLFCFDRDAEALERARRTLSGLECRLDFVHQSFDLMDGELARRGVTAVDRILLDLGVSSLQLDKPERGFSFMRDGPLDMRMNQGDGLSAREVINLWPEERLRHIFQTLGEERHSGRIAKKITETREKRPILTTGDLATLVEGCVPRRGKTHPATRVFQALRMEVNDELGTLSRGLASAGRLLAPGGRLAVITFHSLEDRLVKRTFLKWFEKGLAKPIGAGALACGRAEAVANRRARSAKLRVAERTA